MADVYSGQTDRKDLGALAQPEEIAERLIIDLFTAKCHVNRVLAKLDTDSHTEAVALTFQRGLLG